MQQSSLQPAFIRKVRIPSTNGVHWVAVESLEMRRGAGTSGRATLFLDGRICDQRRRLHLKSSIVVAYL